VARQEYRFSLPCELPCHHASGLLKAAGGGVADSLTDGRWQRFQEELAKLPAGELTLRLGETPDSRLDDLVAAVERAATGTDNPPHAVVPAQNDVALLAQARGELRRLTTTDPLTGLANRTLLVERLQEVFDAVPAGGHQPSLIVLNLDTFKFINDSLGHDAGDAALAAVAERLVRTVGEPHLVARLGGGDFAILVEGVPAEETLQLTAKIRTVLETDIVVADVPVRVEASIGVRFGEAGLAGAQAVHDADMAMQAARSKGGGKVEFFVPTMQEVARQRVELISELREAITYGGLQLRYQPVVQLRTGRIIGAEALVRWDHPHRGPMRPDAFLTAAESGGLMADLGRWVLQEAISQLGSWLPGMENPEAFKLHVNLSPDELRQRDLVALVRQLLADENVPAANLAMEITEHAIMTGNTDTTRTLADFGSLGVGLEIDDFGTGYSSISYLRNLPVDTAKIDRSLIQDVAGDPGQRDFVAAILQLIRAAGLNVVAEGVETREQADQLNALGCPLAQGYYFSRPVTAEQLTVLLQANAPLPAAN
jgi:diguanylate cyclase (GGDEF)-like protein